GGGGAPHLAQHRHGHRRGATRVVRVPVGEQRVVLGLLSQVEGFLALPSSDPPPEAGRVEPGLAHERRNLGGGAPPRPRGGARAPAPRPGGRTLGGGRPPRAWAARGSWFRTPAGRLHRSPWPTAGPRPPPPAATRAPGRRWPPARRRPARGRSARPAPSAPGARAPAPRAPRPSRPGTARGPRRAVPGCRARAPRWAR